MMTSTAANGFAAFILSLGLMLGAPAPIAKAGDTEPAGAQHAKQKKPIAKSGSNTATNPNNTAQGGKHYAKTGICTDCPPLELKPKPRKAKTPPPARTTLPRDWANGENCGMAMPSDPHWAEEKAACANAPNALSRTGKGIPTWPDNHPDTASDSDTPPTNILDKKIHDLGQGLVNGVEQAVTDDVNRAHGAKPTCSGSSSLSEDAASGCGE